MNLSEQLDSAHADAGPDAIVLGSGEHVLPDAVERHYARSIFIRELCVIGVAAPGSPLPDRLHALVVPDRDVLRERKIVNVRELIRFELEGLSVALPRHARVASFDVRMDPLPRTSAGRLRRQEILDMYLGGVLSRRDEAGRPAPADVHVARVVELVRNALRGGAEVRPDSNLELDLGVDSLQRVELLARLEQYFGMRVPAGAAQGLFRVCDVAEVFRGASETAAKRELGWDALLAPAAPGPELRVLLKRRRATPLFVFLAYRMFVQVFVRPQVAGLAHLPPRGPFIISPNHQSYLDPFVLGGVLPFAVFRRLFLVGAAEYFENPLTAWLARMLNIVPVDPDANLLPAMQAAACGLRHGKVLVVFPEGERSIDGHVKAFRNGAAILSRHAGVPIVPVAINGMFGIWPRSRSFAWWRLLPWSRHRVRVSFGAPIHGPESDAAYAEHTAAVRSAVERMWIGAENSQLPIPNSQFPTP